MKTQKVKIEKLVCGGYGLGHVEGGTVFVPYSVPGDELSVEVFSQHSGVQWGKIKDIIVPSPHRRVPFCPHYLNCGGCQLQHISYSYQLECKRLILVDTLGRLGGFKDVNVSSCTASPVHRGYRCRVKLHWSSTKKGFGFYKQRSNTVVPIETCPMLPSEINNCLKGLSSYFRENAAKNLCEIHLIKGSDSKVFLTLKVKSFDKSYYKGLRETGVFGAEVCSGKKRQRLWGPNHIEILTENKVFKIGSEAFFQANLSLLPSLIKEILEQTDNKDDSGVELYSGAGVFSVFIADKLKKLTAVEWNRQAATDAIVNLKNNGIKNTTVHSISAEKGLPMEKTDFILLDPPRDGLSKNVHLKIQKLSPRKIIYVSCDPATLARDLKAFTVSGKYKLKMVKPLDMFPHTSHIETVAVLCN